MIRSSSEKSRKKPKRRRSLPTSTNNHSPLSLKIRSKRRTTKAEVKAVKLVKIKMERTQRRIKRKRMIILIKAKNHLTIKTPDIFDLNISGVY
jgi:hypothetical protein